MPDTPLIFDLFDPNDVPKTVTKGWGSELWIVNISEYCAKILKFNAGKRMSWHYHDIKIETFYVLEGSCVLFVGDSDLIEEAKCLELEPGDKYHIPAGTRHQIIASTDLRVLEISTPHSEQDSFRITKGD